MPVGIVAEVQIDSEITERLGQRRDRATGNGCRTTGKLIREWRGAAKITKSPVVAEPLKAGRQGDAVGRSA